MRRYVQFTLILSFCASLLPAQTGQQVPAAKPDPNAASVVNRPNARAISLSIPAPRGAITDRHGEPLAINRVSYQLYLQFEQLEKEDLESVKEFAQRRLIVAEKILGQPWGITDEKLWEHYRHRRWLPMLHRRIFSEEEVSKYKSDLVRGLAFQPVYTRFYPHGKVAGHVIGFTRSTGKLPEGPINVGDPMWETTSGALGLERIFDKHLQGEPGRKRLMFDQDGQKLLEEQVASPKPGGTVVTTIDLKWQCLAEKILSEKTKAGALVVLDIVTGEVLVLASNPSFDPNAFGLQFDGDEYKKLSEDKSQPMIARAYMGLYPPASTFKPIVGLAGLLEGVLKTDEKIYCPPAIVLGNHTFKNWTPTPEGSIDLAKALARSTNPFFYLISQRMPAEAFLGMARRVGMGRVSELPLDGEKAGLLPDNAYMKRVQKRNLTAGDKMSMSIGQGAVLVTPLQVAMAMAAIGDGSRLPKLHLLRQRQDRFGNVLEAAVPEARNSLGIDRAMIEVVQKGMHDVVNEGYGTGKGAQLSYATVCGKTGTGQWGPESQKRRLAWFAGYFPHDNPRFSYAVLYEGEPGETVSGGRMAAPIVKAFFEGVKEDAIKIMNPPKAMIVEDDSQATPSQGEVKLGGEDQNSEDEADQNVRRAVVVDDEILPDPAASPSEEPLSDSPRVEVVEPDGANSTDSPAIDPREYKVPAPPRFRPSQRR